MSVRVLYLSYDGMTDPLGQSQVLAYLKRIASPQVEIHIISFEKKKEFSEHARVVKDQLAPLNISWHPLPYTKRPAVLSTIYDLTQADRLIARLSAERAFDIVHCRGYITSLLGLRMKRRLGTKFIFDMRGWWADEKIESGNWASPFFEPVYKYFKKQERAFIEESSHAISLTNVGREYMLRTFKTAPEDISVIPTCVDFASFPVFDMQLRQQLRQELRIPQHAQVLVYSGSLGGNYPVSILHQVYQTIKEYIPDAYLMIISRQDKVWIEDQLKSLDTPMDKVRIFSSSYQKIHQYLMAADLGVIFYGEGFSNLGRSPTKLAEYWASGVPVVYTGSAGDLAFFASEVPTALRFIEDKNGLGSWLSEHPDKVQLHALSEEYFSLSRGVEGYKAIYAKLSQP